MGLTAVLWPAILKQGSTASSCRQERSYSVKRGDTTIVAALPPVIAAGGYFAGKSTGEKALPKARERLYTLNRVGVCRPVLSSAEDVMVP